MLQRNTNQRSHLQTTRGKAFKTRSFLFMHLWQLTGTIVTDHRHNKQVLDKLKVERERGITG